MSRLLEIIKEENENYKNLSSMTEYDQYLLIISKERLDEMSWQDIKGYARKAILPVLFAATMASGLHGADNQQLSPKLVDAITKAVQVMDKLPEKSPERIQLQKNLDGLVKTYGNQVQDIINKSKENTLGGQHASTVKSTDAIQQGIQKQTDTIRTANDKFVK